MRLYASQCDDFTLRHPQYNDVRNEANPIHQRLRFGQERRIGLLMSDFDNGEDVKSALQALGLSRPRLTLRNDGGSVFPLTARGR